MTLSKDLSAVAAAAAAAALLPVDHQHMQAAAGTSRGAKKKAREQRKAAERLHADDDQATDLASDPSAPQCSALLEQAWAMLGVAS